MIISNRFDQLFAYNLSFFNEMGVKNLTTVRMKNAELIEFILDKHEFSIRFCLFFPIDDFSVFEFALN